jgi:hypothetical protein
MTLIILSFSVLMNGNTTFIFQRYIYLFIEFDFVKYQHTGGT